MRLAWATAALAFACVVASVALWVVNGYDAVALFADASHGSGALIAVTFSAVGALIASRRPSHRVGWIFCFSGLLAAITELGVSYADHAYRSRPPLPGAELAASLGNFGWVPAMSAIVFLLLRFPDGRALSPRWALADRLTAAGIVLATTGVVALVLRWRRSSGIERLQLKWFTYAAAVTVVLVMVSVDVHSDVLLGALQAVLVGPALAVATGVAILRHRLYDIDVVINRTLVYGALTATLGATYLALVLVLGLAVGHSNLAIAVSTLIVAALFRPARARIQAAVDRRFYRRRYDAARTLERFGSRLRDEVDLDAVQGELVGVIHQTVQPRHVTLWLPRNDSRTHGP